MDDILIGMPGDKDNIQEAVIKHESALRTFWVCSRRTNFIQRPKKFAQKCKLFRQKLSIVDTF